MKKLWLPICCLALSLSLVACKQKGKKLVTPSKKTVNQPPAKRTKAVTIAKGTLAAFGALPTVFENKKNALTQARIDLGRMLYYDKRLSKNHDVSCNSCHKLDKYGVDNEPTSPGHKKQRGDRNSPTVYNAAGHFVQFWDGRSPDVEDQATGPVTNPVEMALKDGKAAVTVLKSIPGYVTAFKKAFPKAKTPLTFTNMGRAIAAFERKLVTPSRWDKFLKGDKKALTDREKLGFKKFLSTGCMACHTGTLLGGHMYQKVGLIKPWPGIKDTGRMKVTKKAGDKFFFKVPSLRNIDKTAPYMHNGAVKTLENAVVLMARHQLGRELKKEDVSLIVAFLKTLTGKLPTDYIKQPKLPASGPKTPKPDPT